MNAGEYLRKKRKAAGYRSAKSLGLAVGYEESTVRKHEASCMINENAINLYKKIIPSLNISILRGTEKPETSKISSEHMAKLVFFTRLILSSSHQLGVNLTNENLLKIVKSTIEISYKKNLDQSLIEALVIKQLSLLCRAKKNDAI